MATGASSLAYFDRVAWSVPSPLAKEAGVNFPSIAERKAKMGWNHHKRSM